MMGAAKGRTASWQVALGLAILTLGPAVADSDQRLEIDTASGAHVFNVEVMRTDAEREHGLMERRSMPADHGMLFDFHVEQPVVFWMKDTLIPLDMIFVAHDGRVVAIKHDAVPMDETLIPSGAPTLGVIELNGGAAKAIDVKIGDRVKNPMFHGVANP